MNMLRYQTSVTIHKKILKSHTRIINLKYLLRHGIKSVSYLMDHTVYEIFKIF